MPVFEYRAKDPQGVDVKGTLQSATMTAAAEALAGRGLQVDSLSAATTAYDPVATYQSEAPKIERTRTTAARGPGETFEQRQARLMGQRSKVSTDVIGPVVGKVPLPDLMIFFRQAATLLNAGVGIVASLDSLAKQTRGAKLQQIIVEMREHATDGRPLSFGMQRYPEVFSPLIISLLRAGEEGGFLEGSLRQIADYLEREIEIRNHLRRVTIYPKILVVAALFIMGGANMILGMIGAKGVFDSSLLSIGTWLTLIPSLVAAFIFIRIGLQNPRFRYLYDELLLKIPAIGPTVKKLCLAKFGHAFGALYKGGVPLPKIVPLAADACGNEFLRSRLYSAQRALESGQGVTEAFVQTGVFPNIVIQMTSTGEATGNLDQMLTKVADYFDDEGRTKSVQLGYILGVLVLLMVCAWVGVQIVGGYMNLSQPVQQQLNES